MFQENFLVSVSFIILALPVDQLAKSVKSAIKFRHITALNSFIKSESMLLYFQMTLILNNLLVFSLYWNFVSPKMRKGLKNMESILIFSIFKFIFLWSYQLEFFRQIFTQDILSIIGFFVKVICCMFDQFFLHPIDGNYRSVTCFLFHFIWPFEDNKLLVKV